MVPIGELIFKDFKDTTCRVCRVLAHYGMFYNVSHNGINMNYCASTRRIYTVLV